jgi:hypothetical protein
MTTNISTVYGTNQGIVEKVILFSKANVRVRSLLAWYQVLAMLQETKAHRHGVLGKFQSYVFARLFFVVC